MRIKYYLLFGQLSETHPERPWPKSGSTTVEPTSFFPHMDRKGGPFVTTQALPGSSLASSAVFPSSMSKSMSRTVLRSWFRGTGERGERHLFRYRINAYITFQRRSGSRPLFGFVLWVRKEASMSRFSEELWRKTPNCTPEIRKTTWT